MNSAKKNKLRSRLHALEVGLDAVEHINRMRENGLSSWEYASDDVDRLKREIQKVKDEIDAEDVF